VTSPPYRRVKLFQKTPPTSGSCTMSVTTSGTVAYTAGVSIEIAAIGSYGPAANATGLSGTPSLTVTTNPGETVYGFLAGKCTPSGGVCTSGISMGSHETLLKDVATAGDIRLAVIQQNGDDGGALTPTTLNNLWPFVGLATIPSPALPPSTAQLTQTKYKICNGYGEDTTVVCRATNTPASTGPTGLLRVRVEIAGSVATTTEFGIALYCSRNGGSYARAMDAFNGNAFRLYGPGPSTLTNPIPASLATLTAKLGSPVISKFLRDQSSVYLVPALTVGQTIEAEWALQLNAAVNDTITCRARKDDGSVLDAYTQTPTITVRNVAATRGF